MYLNIHDKMTGFNKKKKTNTNTPNVNLAKFESHFIT